MEVAETLAALGVVALLVTVGAAALLAPQPDDDTAPATANETDTEPEGDDPDRRSDDTSMLVGLQEVDRPTENRTWPVYGPDGNRTGNRTWRVVEDTGNCCENYITTTPKGRIIDLGGTYPYYTDDGGQTWTRVQAETPFVNGEGALAVAPDGDVLAVMWDPYTGDRLVSYRWDAETATWDYAETPLKTPFFDRPWLSVIPGPIEVAGQTHEYVAYLRGGFPSKEVAYVSTDGLHYVRPSSPNADSLHAGTTTLDEVQADSWADWIQPHTESAVTPMPGGGALIHQGAVGSCPWKRVTDDLTWSCVEETGLDGGRALVDSRGRLHNLQVGGSQVRYRISSDAGAHWNGTEVDLPDRYAVEDWDVKVHAGLGEAVVAVHAYDEDADADQDMVLRFDVDGASANLTSRALVGDGDLLAESGAGSDNRFDFTTVGLLPDGRVAVSFTDQDHHPPALAVQTEPEA